MTLMERLLATRTSVFARLDAIRAAADEREGRDLTDDELSQVRALREELDQVDERIAEVSALESRRDNATTADQDPASRSRETTVRVANEPLTYREFGPHSFFADAYRARYLMDDEAQARLSTHRREMRVIVEERRNEQERRSASTEWRPGDHERRDVGSSAVGGLMVPQYLVDEFAPVLRNGRSFANAIRRVPLPPEGLSLVIPRGSTGVAVAPQATENTAVQETDLNWNNDLTVPVRTFAGMQDISRQTLERGTPGIDRLIFEDLVAAYAARLDSSIINDDGTAGTHKGVRSASGTNAVTYTDATPTVAEAWPKLADSVQRIGTNRKLSANLIVMHTRRWGWVIAAVDSQNRPLVIHGDESAAVNAMGQAANDFGEGQLVGTLQGLPVLVDANLPTTVGAGTEDVILVIRRQDPILWEDGNGVPRELRFDDVNSGTLTIRLLAYGYSAFTAERYANAVSIISGTGLIAPTF